MYFPWLDEAILPLEMLGPIIRIAAVNAHKSKN